jgi:hypothetical protein
MNIQRIGYCPVSTLDSQVQRECDPDQHHSVVPWPILGGQGEPLGSSVWRPPKPNLVGAYSDTWLCLLESHFWDWGIVSMPVLD